MGINLSEGRFLANLGNSPMGEKLAEGRFLSVSQNAPMGANLSERRFRAAHAPWCQHRISQPISTAKSAINTATVIMAVPSHHWMDRRARSEVVTRPPVPARSGFGFAAPFLFGRPPMEYRLHFPAGVISATKSGWAAQGHEYGKDPLGKVCGPGYPTAGTVPAANWRGRRRHSDRTRHGRTRNW
jgi:hypothetical protein